MKTSIILTALVMAGTFTACHKTSFVAEQNDAGAYGSTGKSFAGDVPDTMCIPINEMGSQTYLGYQGGFYPNGATVPQGQYAADLDSINKTIWGLDTAGNRRNKAGTIVIGGIGACLSGAPISGLRRRKKNPNTVLNINWVNFEAGGQGASWEDIADPNSNLWDYISQKIVYQNTTYKQVQMLWMTTDDSSTVTDWPTRPLIAKENIKSAARTLKMKFPNLKILYMVGRPYTWDLALDGKITNVRSRNPAPYHQGWAEKWAIEDQINGDPGMAYNGPNAVAPILTWGEYQWTHAKAPNADGFFWLPSDTRDGLHPTDEGKDKIAQYFWNFFYTDPYASQWFLR